MKDDLDPRTVIIVILLAVIAGLISQERGQLPPNCHLTPSVDVGGSEVECD